MTPDALDSSLQFIVITADEGFYLKLRGIASDCGWPINRASSIDEAAAAAADCAARLVVYEGAPDDEAWEGAVKRLNGLPGNPCVLLASSVADDNLLREVIHNHGFDILPKAASSEKLASCLNFAWLAAGWGRGRI